MKLSLRKRNGDADLPQELGNAGEHGFHEAEAGTEPAVLIDGRLNHTCSNFVGFKAR